MSKIPAHYHPCANCAKARESGYPTMFYCEAKSIQIPNEETMHGCITYAPRTDGQVYI
jgi:hypothetical protein